jgi:threonine synthase
MWPWEEVPRSIAHGILDDETYDWLAVVEAMQASGGEPLVASELSIVEANSLAREATGIAVDHTGSAGLAGVLQLRTHGGIDPDERVGVLFTGGIRIDTATERTDDEELLRPRHPVAEGLRAG